MINSSAYPSCGNFILKRTVLVCVTFLASLCSSGQNNWLRKAGGNNLDEALDITKNPVSENYYVTGYISGAANFNTPTGLPFGGNDVFLASYDASGTPQWAKIFGGSSGDRSLAVAADAGGNSYICGYYSQTATFGNFTLTAEDSTDIFVAKVSNAGQIIWVKSAGGNGNDAAVGIAVDSQGHVVITGLFRGAAQFGTINLVSTDNTNGSPSSDLFTARLDNNGNWLWVKKGSSNTDDRPTDVCVDGQNNIYITGQFSGDITFDQTHTNTTLNVGYLVKYNSAGQEQWFSKMAAVQCSPNAVRCDSGNNVIVTGDGIGQMIFYASNNSVLTTTNSQYYFLVKYNSSGAVTWSTEDGSVSYVSCRALSIGPANEIYVGGIFECTFTEYSDLLGQGLFNSAGYRDVFTARFSATGEREWMRQYGGPLQDNCTGITSSSTQNQPRIAGSFEKYFHSPSGNGNFTINTTNFIPGTNDNLSNPNSSSVCGINGYGNFVSLESYGNKDIFIGNLFNSALPHYDFYSRAECESGITEPCINDSGEPLVCLENLVQCNSASIELTFNTGSNCWIGPEYEWNWSDGSNQMDIDVSESGWYSVEVERKDGCKTFTDSIYVDILESPVPTITDDQGINFNSPPDATTIVLCAPATIELTGDSENNNLVSYWTTPDNTTIPEDVITVSESGNYTYSVAGENGCVGTNTIAIDLVDPIDEIDPLLTFNAPNLPVNDTLIICGNEYVNMTWNDLLEQEDFPIYVDANWQVSTDQGYYPEVFGFESYSFMAQFDGWHYITSTPYIFSPEPCPPDTIWYPAQTLEVYIILLDAPNPQPTLTGGQPFCPGDTLLLTASGANSYIFSGPGIIDYPTPNSILINQAGGYSVNSLEQFPNGCSGQGFDTELVPLIAAPLVTSNPSHGVLCPGASLVLTCTTSDSYAWFGPLGQQLGNSQSITVSQPGSYYCSASLNGCTQESNFFDVQLYATPYLTGLPATDLCVSGVVTLIAQTNASSQIQWQSPLSGNSASINVFSPGIYSAIIAFCEIETTISIEITMSMPVAQIVPSSGILCPTGSITLSANAGMAEYSWTPGGQNTQSIVVTQPGNYSVTIEDSNGCGDQSNSFTIDVYPINPPSIQNAAVCFGNSANLFASGQNIFWATDEAATEIIHTGNSFQTPPVEEEIIYYVFNEDDNCVSAANDVVITVRPSSLLYINEADSGYCAGEQISLSTQPITSAGINYNWLTPAGNTITSSTLTINPALPIHSGWYYFRAQDIYCSSPKDSIYITVENPVNADLISEPEIALCVNSELIIQAGIESETYVWNTPLGTFTTSEIVIDETEFNAAGNYTLTVPGTFCPFNSDTAEVRVVAYPEVVLSDSMVYCDRGYMTAHLPAGYDVYAWNNGDTDNEAIVPVDGYVFVTITNLPGCSDTAAMQVRNIDCINEFPNVFTPNQDGDNSYIDFEWLRIPIDEVLIYNRWGNLIRHYTDGPFIWDGKNESLELVSDGVYYYVVKSKDPGKQFHNLSGYIHVLGSDGTTRN